MNPHKTEGLKDNGTILWRKINKNERNNSNKIWGEYNKI